MCEGDDFWSDPLKLQKQVDFLEINSEYILCSANAIVENLTNKPFRSVYCHFEKSRSFDQEQIINEFYCPTLSMVFRNPHQNWPDWFYDVKSGDSFLQLILSQYGKFYYLNFIAGTYRQLNGGVSNLNNAIDWLANNITYLTKVKELVASKNEVYIKESIFRSQLEYISALISNKQNLKAIFYFGKLKKMPLSIHKKYFRREIKLFAKALLKQ